MTNIEKKLFFAVHNGHLDQVKAILQSYPHLLSMNVAGNTLLHIAVRHSKKIKLIKFLIDSGIDINTPMSDSSDRPLHEAASKGFIDIAEWLLDHGADVDGCLTGGATPLLAAIKQDNLEMVKLLVSRGASTKIRIGNPPANFFDTAMMLGHVDIACFLKENSGEDFSKKSIYQISEKVEINAHLEKYLGREKNMVFSDAASGFKIFSVINLKINCITLLTNGMSDKEMTAPKGWEDYRYIELLIHLPINWPLSIEELEKSKNSWPIDWLRMLADYPFENNRLLCSEDIISNGDPVERFSSETELSCFLVLEEPSEFGILKTNSGKTIRFYELHPLYIEERDFFLSEGLEALLHRFEIYNVDRVIDPKRLNVAKF